MKKLNKKGFTLVELLAVIVVLAIIMVLTVPSVLSSMNSARQSSFLLYAGKMLEAAQGKYQSESLLTTPGECYDLTYLSGNGSTQYSGYVFVTADTEGNLTFKLRMYDGNYQIGYTTDSNIGDVEDGVTYATIETLKKSLSDKKSLKAAPKTDTEKESKKTVGEKQYKVYPTKCTERAAL